MILRKKHIPLQYHSMWYAGILNLCLSVFQISLYFVRDNLFTLLSGVFLFVMFIFMFWLMNKTTKEKLWRDLTKN